MNNSDVYSSGSTFNSVSSFCFHIWNYAWHEAFVTGENFCHSCNLSSQRYITSE